MADGETFDRQREQVEDRQTDTMQNEVDRQ